MRFKNLIFILSVSIVLIMLLGCTNVKAATYSIDATPTKVNEGENVTINVSFTAASWNVTVSGDKIKGEIYASHTADLSEVTTTKSFNMDTSKEGTYEVKISGDITDKDGNTINVDKTVTVNVTKKEEPKDEPTETPTTPGEQEQPNNDEQPNNNEQPSTQPQENEQPNTQEPTFTETTKTMYVKSNCDKLNVRKEPNSYSSTKIEATLKSNSKITVLAIGSNGWNKIRTEDGIVGYVDRSFLTEEKPTLSSTATLANIIVNPSKLNETFSKDVFMYSMNVDAEVDTIQVNATPTDSKADVVVTGNTALKTGTGNVIKIKVTAEDGISTKLYTIKVTKLASEEENPNIIEENNEENTDNKKLGLSTLEIEGTKLTPTFKSDIYEYKANITDESVEGLIVNAKATIDDAKVEIIGADKIENGDNEVKIIVTSLDGEETVTYKIVVKKSNMPSTTVSKVEENKKTDVKPVMIIGIIVAIAALIVTLIIIKKKEKNTQGIKIFQDGDYNEEDDDNSYNNKTYSDYLKENNEEDNEDNQNEIDGYEEDDDEDDDDDWGVPKRGFWGKFKNSGRHF